MHARMAEYLAGMWEPTAAWIDKLPDLFRSVLLQAVVDLQRPPRLKAPYDTTRTDRISARDWLLSESLYLFSFRSICTLLGLEPAAVRKALAPWLCPALVHLRPIDPPPGKNVARLRRAQRQRRG